MLGYISQIQKAFRIRGQSPFFRVSRYLSSWLFENDTDQEMFNRQREIKCLSQLLKSKPEFSIITGPVDSGKTRLIEHILHELPNKTMQSLPICPINLRKGNYYTVQSLVDSLSMDLGSWLYKIKKYLSESDGEVSAGGGSISLKLQRKIAPSDSLNYLLKEVAQGLPARTLLRGKQRPILFIDEANRLRTLLSS